MAQTWFLTVTKDFAHVLELDGALVGDEYRELELTVGDCEDVCRITGGSWDAIVPSAHPTSLRATWAVFLERKGQDATETLEKLKGLPAVLLLKTVGWEDEDDRPDVWTAETGKLPTPDPKEATKDEPSSTTTSPSASTSSTGRRTKQGNAPSETSD